MAVSAARNLAFKTILKINAEHSYSNLAVAGALKNSGLQNADKALFTALVYGVVERKITLDYNLTQYLTQPLKKLNPKAYTALLLGAYQILFMDKVPNHAAINESVELTGVVLTKLDGDTRGGAAISVRAVTGKPIKFSGTGEKLEDLEVFHPDRMASRILGMGDVLSLIEKAQTAYDEKQAAELSKKMRSDSFTLDDFLQQLDQMKNMGSMEELLAMIPGAPKNLQVDEKAMARTRAIICSMTRKERADPSLLNASRRKRIAKGSGTTVQDVNRLMNQFEQSRKLMKQMSSGKMFRKGRHGGMPFGF